MMKHLLIYKVQGNSEVSIGQPLYPSRDFWMFQKGTLEIRDITNKTIL